MEKMGIDALDAHVLHHNAFSVSSSSGPNIFSTRARAVTVAIGCRHERLCTKELGDAIKAELSQLRVSFLSEDEEDIALDVLADSLKENPKFAWLGCLENSDLDSDETKYNFSMCLQSHANHRILSGTRGIAVGARNGDGNLVGCMTLVPSSCARERKRDRIAAAIKYGTSLWEKYEEYCPDFVRRTETLRGLPKKRAALMSDVPRWIYVQAIGIRPEERGMGYSRELLRLLVKTADRLGTPVYLEADSKNDEQMYKKFGFRTFELVHALALGAGVLTLYLMRRDPRCSISRGLYAHISRREG